MNWKEKIELRDVSNSVLRNIVSLYTHLYPELRYIQNLWAIGIIDHEDRFSEEPYDTVKRILPKIVDTVNTGIKPDDFTSRIFRSNLFDGLEKLGLACKTEDFELKLL